MIFIFGVLYLGYGENIQRVTFIREKLLFAIDSFMACECPLDADNPREHKRLKHRENR